MMTLDEPLKLWTTAASAAIAAGAPVDAIAAWLDHGLTLDPELFQCAARAHHAEMLAFLLDQAQRHGPDAVHAGVMAALAPPSATENSVLDNVTCARTVLAHATPDLLNRPKSRMHGGRDVPVWWHAFRNAHDGQDLAALLRLLREYGADLAATPFSGESDEGGGVHGDALRALLLNERIEKERAVLRQAMAEATEQPTTAARGRRRL
jgi:hypothetical protein